MSADDVTSKSAGSRKPEYGSDHMVDVLQSLDLEYIALNPGSSFRGLHDSLVNYGGNSPKLIECPHEKVAVGLAHGFARATGKPMAVILHNVVGLLHGAMGIYYAHIDRTPVIVLGGAGPMDVTRRRPSIDWIHTANVQGNAVRDYTKWDDQPTSLGSIAPSIYRAYRVAMQEPCGPVYIGLDAALQEDRIEGEVPTLDPKRLKVPAPIGADPSAFEQLVDYLVEAKKPLVITGYAGRNPETVGHLVELAEMLAIGVIDTNIRLNFPNRHPQNVTGSEEAFSDTDLVMFLDVKDLGHPTQTVDSIARQRVSRLPEGTRVIDVGFNDLGLSAWSHDFASLEETDLQITADTGVVLPGLLESCRGRLADESPTRAEERARRRAELERLHDQQWSRSAAEVKRRASESPVSLPHLVSETWEAVREYDWVLSAGGASAKWAMRLWDFDKPYRHPGKGLGTATQISMALGVALAHREHGRLVVDIQPDGDLMFDPGALWVATHHKIPMLVVMFNNRAYYNDWAHQVRMAKERGTPESNAYIGMDIDDPAPDFATIARAFGWYGDGPITEPERVRGAVAKAAEVVMTTGQPALVDVVCQHA